LVTISIRFLGIISMIIVLSLSYIIYFISQNDAEKNIKNTLRDQQVQRQLETNRAIAFHITSDFDSILTRMNLIADSPSIQSGDFQSINVQILLNEQYSLITSLTARPDAIFIIDNKSIVRSLRQNGEFTNVNANLSTEHYVISSEQSLKPVVSVLYSKKDGPRIVLGFPILQEGTNKYLGLVVALMPSTMFSNYGNIYGITFQYIVVLDKNGNHIAHGNKALIGKNFFDDYTQNFTKHNAELNNLIKNVLQGQSGYLIYEITSGERVTTGFPVKLYGEAIFFVFVVTPTAPLYAQVANILQLQKTETVLLLILVTASAAIFIIFLLFWTSRLDKAVNNRTLQLKSLNEILAMANEKLELQDKMQKDFINIAAHELRTPVQAILGYAEMIKINPQKAEYLSSILNNASRLQEIIDDVLDVSRIESNRLPLEKEPFFIEDLILEVAEDYSKRISVDSNTNVQFMGEKKDKIKLLADKTRIRRVLMNLINNAIKFTKSGSIIVQATKDSAGKNVIISVEDAGKGVDPEVIPNLFEKFVTKSKKGLGLGLFIARNIVESHGGKIWFEKNPKGGSIFKFTIPLTGQDEK
jgi:signal transduction histidine kinase